MNSEPNFVVETNQGPVDVGGAAVEHVEHLVNIEHLDFQDFQENA